MNLLILINSFYLFFFSFLFKIILKNQCLKFKIQGTDLSDKRVFLGNFVTYPNIISSISAIKIYVFDKDNRIIDV